MVAKRIKGTKITKKGVTAPSKPKPKSMKLKPVGKRIHAKPSKLSPPAKVDKKDQDAEKKSEKRVGLSLN